MKKYFVISIIFIITGIVLGKNWFDEAIPTYNPSWAKTFDTNVQEITTPKGITFWYKETPSSPSFSIVFQSYFEPKDQTKEYSFFPFDKYEATRFISAMMDKGTSTRSADDIREFLQKNNVSGHISADVLGVSGFFNFLSEDTKSVMPVLQDMIHNPAFELKYLNIIKQQQDSYWENAENNNSLLLYYQKEKNIYKDNADVFGKESYAHITTVDMHRGYKKLLRKEGLQISVATHLSAKNVAKYIDILFGDIKNTYDTPYERYFPSVIPKVTQNIETKNKKQTEIMWYSTPVKYTDTIEIEFDILKTMLVSDLSSYLYQRLREEKGLVYNLSLNMNYLKTDDLISIVGRTEVANDRAQEFLNVLKNTYNDIINKNVINAESVLQAKKNMIMQIIYSMRTNNSIASTMDTAQNLGFDIDFVNDNSGTYYA